jgi:hypothetical protein
MMPRKNLTVASLGQGRSLCPCVAVALFDVTLFEVTLCRCDTMEVRNHWSVAGVRVE